MNGEAARAEAIVSCTLVRDPIGGTKRYEEIF